jgi:hypothetical protein
MNSESLVIGAKTVGTIGAVHLTTLVTPEHLPMIIEAVLQVVVAIGGLISLFRKRDKK